MSRRHPSGYIRPGYNPLEVADAPTSPGASAGSEAASVSFTAPADEGGSTITNYYAVSNPGQITGTSVTSPIAVSGLTNGTEYTFKVWGENSYGPSPYSESTSAVTPTPPDITDVFSTWLYTGNGSTQTITNGINLSGDGGLVWIKNRGNAVNHALVDTARGAGQYLSSNTTTANTSTDGEFTGFTSSGFGLDSLVSSIFNANTETYTSWTFRKAPKFFDVVTYTGDGVSGRTVAHNLGSVPGCIIVKRTSGADNWTVYHRGIDSTSPQNYIIYLNTADGRSDQDLWADTAPTDSVFSVGSNIKVNGSGSTYVAYLFAHDASGFGDSGDESVISCGSYLGTGGSPGPVVNLGWEPQWLLVKRSSLSGTGWVIYDNMRGVTADGTDKRLVAQNTSAESDVTTDIVFTATGFTVAGYQSATNEVDETFIYIAIRRGPMKTPTDGAEVFEPVALTPSSNQTVTTGFPVDWTVLAQRSRASSGYTFSHSRLQGGNTANIVRLSTNTTDVEYTSSSGGFSFQNNSAVLDSWYSSIQGFNSSTIYWNFRRAPGFFDEVCYTGTGAASQSQSHNLAAVPELIIWKCRNDARDWTVYTAALGVSGLVQLNSTNANNAAAAAACFNTAPTDTTFYFKSDPKVGANNFTYVTYLFATCPGVSKVGSYTGTATTLQIDCGFTSGARFVLIKRTDSTGDWYVWDSARGIIAGDDPYLLLNSTAAEVTNTDYVDTYSAGFEITSTAPAAINASGGTFIYLAIA